MLIKPIAGDALHAIWGKAAQSGVAKSSHFLQLETFLNMRNLVAKILTRFDPANYFFVGLGRSPTPVIRYLEALKPTIACDLPFSGAGYLNREPLIVQRNRAEIKEHFNRHLPSITTLGARKLVIIDYVCSGDSLKGAIHAVTQHYCETVNVLGAALTHCDVTEGAHNGVRDHGHIAQFQAGRHISDAFVGQDFDGYARFGPWYGSWHYRNHDRPKGYRPAKNNTYWMKFGQELARVINRGVRAEQMIVRQREKEAA